MPLKNPTSSSRAIAEKISLFYDVPSPYNSEPVGVLEPTQAVVSNTSSSAAPEQSEKPLPLVVAEQEALVEQFVTIGETQKVLSKHGEKRYGTPDLVQVRQTLLAMLYLSMAICLFCVVTWILIPILIK